MWGMPHVVFSTRKGSRDRDGGRVVGIILIEASHDLDIDGESAPAMAASIASSIASSIAMWMKPLWYLWFSLTLFDSPHFEAEERTTGYGKWMQVIQVKLASHGAIMGNWCRSWKIYHSFFKHLQTVCKLLLDVSCQRGDPFNIFNTSCLNRVMKCNKM